MARRPLTPRQIQLHEALAQLKAEQLVLRQQRLRGVAAKREVDRLCRCDCCGAKTSLPAGTPSCVPHVLQSSASSNESLCWLSTATGPMAAAVCSLRMSLRPEQR